LRFVKSQQIVFKENTIAGFCNLRGGIEQKKLKNQPDTASNCPHKTLIYATV